MTSNSPGWIVLAAAAASCCVSAGAHAQGRSADAAQTDRTPRAPWEVQANGAAKPADVIYHNYRFRNGQVLPDLRIHYATLGQPHRNAAGEIDNAVMVLHWTGASGASLLSPNYMSALFDPGRPLDRSRYFLIFPDNVGHGRSSKPSDGLHAAFPNYRYGDIVDLQHRLITETLGIKRLRAILGMSMGGMNAWQ